MNLSEHLFTIVGEEGAEITQRASKIVRFGLLEIEPGQQRDNRARLLGEFADMCGALELALPGSDIVEMVQALRPEIDAKKTKIKKFLDYSKGQGTLRDG